MKRKPQVVRMLPSAGTPDPALGLPLIKLQLKQRGAKRIA